jgi:hypothetical protein
MNTKEELNNEIEEASEPILTELLYFVHFIKAKKLRERMDTA